ncbi:MAG TPA: gamma-glutamyl-gamma-aminobutyrate hydrolase family protein [Polyangia bacterium]|jgi:GMP synthase-like glutamine amidotransferase|nr:gamma-glutamyl-gamma-aminobutyrate hydrolase family protein [Polyangia bacterium]
MKRAIVIQHVAMEGPGRIAELLAERGVRIELREVFAGAPVPRSLDADQLLVVMGGGMDVGERDDPRYPFLNPEIALLQRALADQRPILGVCLGAQLLAHAAGGRVYPNVRRDSQGREQRVREVGWGPITLEGAPDEPAFEGLAREQTVLHWHGDTFDLPPGATWLASTPVCANQAFRVGPRAFGLQFHVEADAALAKRWAVEDADFVRAARGPHGTAEVLDESDRLAEAARAPSERLIRNIIGCLLA